MAFPDPDAHTNPALQLKQEMDPAGLNLPGGHTRVQGEVKPMATLYRPGLQLVHVTAPGALYVPPGQMTTVPMVDPENGHM